MIETEIALNTIAYENAVASMQAQIERIDPVTSDVPDVTCRADTMKMYKAKVNEIGLLLELYKSLLVKDHTDLRQVQISFVETDRSLSAEFSRSPLQRVIVP